jgi:Uma2 family endonuclease
MSVVISTPLPDAYQTVHLAETFADVVARLGDVPLSRIRSKPAPGTATENDILVVAEQHGIHCELVDGVLVEKPVGYYESKVAFILGSYIQAYLRENPIASAAGENGPLRTTPGQVRLPDISVILNDRLTLKMIKEQKILDLPPDIAVEVLSESNTKKEMDRKLREYFQAGTRLVWYIDPETEIAEVFTSPDASQRVSGDQELDGRDILPGFSIKLGVVFAEAKAGMPKK